MGDVVITGIGLVTPLGSDASEVLDRVLSGVSAAQAAPFSPPIACRQFAPVADFDAQRLFPDNKTLRLMNREAQLAVVAARQAMQDARLVPRAFYPPEEIGLFGATGLSGIAPEEIVRLVRDAATPEGAFDVARFGGETLRHIRPVLSFKILANMPICFVSIFQNLRGPNAVYTPWEGHGAQAIAAGVRAIRSGEIDCAVVGGCDVKTHVLSLVSLQQLGALDSWLRHGRGSIPAEGAAFLVLEHAVQAAHRGAPIHAAIREFRSGSIPAGGTPTAVFQEILSGYGSQQAAFVLEAVKVVGTLRVPPPAHGVCGLPTCVPDARIPRNKSPRRVMITGLGVVSPVGVGREAFWSALVAGESGVGPITLFDAAAFPVRIGGEVKDFDARRVWQPFPETSADRDRKVLLAMAAAGEALADAGAADVDLQDALVHVGVGLETIHLEDFTAWAQAADFGWALAQRLAPGRPDRALQRPLDRIATRPGDEPSLPESLLMESLFQLGNGLLILSSEFQQIGLVVRFEEVRFTNRLRPGRHLRMEATVRSWRDDGVVFDGSGSADGEAIVAGRGCLAAPVPLADYADPADLRVLFSEIHRPEESSPLGLPQGLDGVCTT